MRTRGDRGGRFKRDGEPRLPLGDIRVLDLSTPLGAYCGRLLCDLGADVVRVEPSSGAPARRRPPLIGGVIGATFAFTEAGKNSVVLDSPESTAREQLHRLVDETDILITSEGPGALRAKGLHPEQTTADRPRLLHVAITPFGLTGPRADWPASDLTILAAGGLLSLAGDPDRPPVRPAPEQTPVMAGAHGAVATMLALHVRDATGRGQVVDLSAQECVAHSLENAVQMLDLEGIVRTRVGPGPVEVGTGLFRCRDGLVYLVGGIGGRGLAWDAIVRWLAEEGADEFNTLSCAKWGDRSWRRTTEGTSAFRELFERFAATRTKDQLYEAGQLRGISISAVATPEDLLANVQLCERGFFREVEVAHRSVTLPGAPYRFAGLDIGPVVGAPALGSTPAEHPWRAS